jgi:periplasmic protein TonB
MNRLWAAVLLAVSFHGGLFWIGSDWKMSKSLRPPISSFVTVTMSYQRPVKVAEVKKEAEVKPRKISKPKKTKTAAPKKPEQEPVPPEPIAAQPVQQQPAPVVEQEEIRDAGDEKGSNEAGAVAQKTPGEVGTKGDAGSSVGVIREAVPLYKINPPPNYPKTAKRRGYQGKVVVSVYVDDQGRVEKLWLFESSGYNILDNSVLEAVKEWIFEPGMKGDQKVAMWVKVPVRFELKE